MRGGRRRMVDECWVECSVLLLTSVEASIVA